METRNYPFTVSGEEAQAFMRELHPTPTLSDISAGNIAVASAVIKNNSEPKNELTD